MPCHTIFSYASIQHHHSFPYHSPLFIYLPFSSSLPPCKILLDSAIDIFYRSYRHYNIIIVIATITNTAYIDTADCQPARHTGDVAFSAEIRRDEDARLGLDAMAMRMLIAIDDIADHDDLALDDAKMRGMPASYRPVIGLFMIFPFAYRLRGLPCAPMGFREGFPAAMSSR